VFISSKWAFVAKILFETTTVYLRKNFGPKYPVNVLAQPHQPAGATIR
jgi:hypothetical protein